MNISFKLVLVATLLSLAACQTMDNRSLEYQNAKQIAPLKMPADLTIRPSLALYPAPIVDVKALENAPVFENQRGNRYQLPRPIAGQSSQASQAKFRPYWAEDTQQNPLLEITGDVQAVWYYVNQAITRQTVYTVSSRTDKSLNITHQGQNYTIYMSQVEDKNTLAVFDRQGQFADKYIAKTILTTIYQNWP